MNFQNNILYTLQILLCFTSIINNVNTKLIHVNSEIVNTKAYHENESTWKNEFNLSIKKDQINRNTCSVNCYEDDECIIYTDNYSYLQYPISIVNKTFRDVYRTITETCTGIINEQEYLNLWNCIMDYWGFSTTPDHTESTTTPLPTTDYFSARRKEITLYDSPTKDIPKALATTGYVSVQGKEVTPHEALRKVIWNPSGQPININPYDYFVTGIDSTGTQYFGDGYLPLGEYGLMKDLTDMSSSRRRWIIIHMDLDLELNYDMDDVFIGTCKDDEDTTTSSSSTGSTECTPNCAIPDSDEFVLCVGESFLSECPPKYNGQLSYYCNNGGILNINDTCIPSWINDIEEAIKNGTEPANDIAQNVQEETAKENFTKPVEITSTVTVLRDLIDLQSTQLEQSDKNETEKQETVEKFLDDYTVTTNNLLKMEKPWQAMEEDDLKINGPNLFLQLEETGWLLLDQIPDDSTYERNWTSSETELIIKIFNQSYLDSEEIRFKSKDGDSEILITDKAFLLNKNKTIKMAYSSLKYESANLTIPGILNQHESHKNITSLNSEILSLSFENPKVTKLKYDENEKVQINFDHHYTETEPYYRDLRRNPRNNEEPTGILKGTECVYWDTILLTWSTEGCFVFKNERNKTTCRCNHLTMFSILTDIHGLVGRDDALDIIGSILSSLSFVSLLLTLYILLTYRENNANRNSYTNTIKIHLCISLGILHMCLLLFLDRDFLKLSSEGCSITAAILHFFALTSIFWMLAEGIYLWISITFVFDLTIIHLSFYYILGYGVPAMIVIITVLTSLGTNDWTDITAYNRDNYCWLRTEDYIWAFTGPLIFIIVVNTIVLIMAFRAILNLKKNQNLTGRHRIMVWIKGVFSLNCILGPSWVFGILYISTNFVFAYIFTIFNASQGILILFFQIWSNDKVKEILKRKYYKITKWIRNTQIKKTFNTKFINIKGYFKKDSKSNSISTQCTFSTDIMNESRKPSLASMLGISSLKSNVYIVSDQESYKRFNSLKPCVELSDLNNLNEEHLC